MIRISGSCELASSYHRRIKLSAGNDSWECISLYNFNNQRTWRWFLRIQIVYQRRAVPELATFLAAHAHAVDSDVEANPQKRNRRRDGIQLTVTHLVKIWNSIICCHASSGDVEYAVEIDNEEWLLKAWTSKVKATIWTRMVFWLKARSNDARILYTSNQQ